MKLLLLVVILSPTVFGLEDQICDFVEGYWNGFNGSSCASHAQDFCENSFSIGSHIYYMVQGDWYEFFEIFTDLSEMGWEAWDMWDDCSMWALIKEFFHNLWIIIKQWPLEIYHSFGLIPTFFEFIGEGNYYEAGELWGTGLNHMITVHTNTTSAPVIF